MSAPRPLAVVDIDGVVADVAHRLVHLRSDPADWDLFFAAAADDPPLVDGVVAVQTLLRDHDVAWLSGRPERLRSTTVRWLAAQGLPTSEVHLRADRDRRPAAVTKADLLRAFAGDRDVVIVLDDDPTVVEALTRAGWPAVLADWCPREDVLRRAQGPQGRT